MNHLQKIKDELHSENDILEHDELTDIAANLIIQSEKLKNSLDGGQDLSYSAIFKILEFAGMLSNHIEHNVEDSEKTEETPQPKYPFAVIDANKHDIATPFTKHTVAEDFTPIKTFETLPDAIAFVKESKDESFEVVRVNWDEKSISIAFMQE